MPEVLDLGDVSVDVFRKNIKNLHLSVHPPTGRVRVAAPLSLGIDAIRTFAISRLAWIRRSQRKLLSQPRELARDYVDRESHFVWGERVLLRVVDHDGPPSLQLNHRALVLKARETLSLVDRHQLLENWYREALRAGAEEVLPRWETLLKVKAHGLFVQRMKTRWGSCNPERGHIRLNTELAKKPRECLDYVVLHELAHMVERTHSEKFYSILDNGLPQWRQIRELLNSLPLSTAPQPLRAG
jgi:predicted metal-dependent hydrolase